MRSIVACLACVVATAAPAPLVFRDGSFTIGQLADLHYGEGEDVWWGPVQDSNSTRVVKSIIASEPDLDLFVFSGDQITGNNIRANATAYLRTIFDTPAAAQIPWATAYGNHDDAALQASGDVRRAGSVTTRTELAQFEQSTYPGLSHTQLGPPKLPGVSNYVLPVFAEAGAATPSLLLYFVDSGGGSYAEEVFPDQIAWLNATIYENAERFSGVVPSLTFVHIPTEEFVTAYVPPGPGSPCFGILADDGVTPTDNNTGLFALLAGATGAPVHNAAVFVGHDHGNAWCCNVDGMFACFGRHSGYGGYGDWDRGSRMIRATLAARSVLGRTEASVATIETWVRMEDGSINSAGCLLPPRGAAGCG